MRAFNPEKELKKIQRGNKNKVIIGIIALLLIISIGSTYALYQIRYSKRVIYTKVAPFYNKDIILSVKLDDQEKSADKFPDKEEGYVYSHIECEKDNITNVNWDKENWKLNADINGPDKCTVFFAKSPFNMKSCEGKEMSECLLEEGPKFENILAFDDPDQNARYYGKDPANYIWFNCDDYSNPSEKTCERWRIIGSFKNIEKVNEDGTTTNQNLIKLVRTDSIGGFSYDVKEIGPEDADNKGYNEWADAELMYLLNPDNEEHTLIGEKANNSLYWNRDVGRCAVWKNIVNCDFTSKGLKGSNEDKTKKMIEKVIWHLGGHGNASVLPNDLYNSERGTETCATRGICSERTAEWSGNIALIYASDFDYATGGGATGRSTCLSLPIWNQDPYNADCIGNDWLLGSSSAWTRTLTPFSTEIARTYYYGDSNNHLFYFAVEYNGYTLYIRPSLYLTHNTKITSGEGTYESPYVINVN